MPGLTCFIVPFVPRIATHVFPGAAVFRAPGIRIELCWAKRGVECPLLYCTHGSGTSKINSTNDNASYWNTRWATIPSMWNDSLMKTCLPLFLSLPVTHSMHMKHPRHVALGVIVLVALILGLVNGPGVWPRSVSVIDSSLSVRRHAATYTSKDRYISGPVQQPGSRERPNTLDGVLPVVSFGEAESLAIELPLTFPSAFDCLCCLHDVGVVRTGR